MNQKVLVTGGMGFVGGRVAQALAARGELIVLGSRRTQMPPSWLPDANVIEIDWHSEGNLRAACEGVDCIVHLAGMNDSECVRDPVAALEINGVNTARLVEAAKASGVTRFVYMSTAHVYGSPLAGRIDEATLPQCRHPYATSHRAAEDVVLAANGQLASVVLRLSNGFGAPAHADVNAWMLLVNDLCRQAASRHGMALRSSGLQQRDFVTLHDVANAVSHMIDLPGQMLGNGIFNVGAGKSTRVIDMAELIRSRCAEVLGFTPEITRPDLAGNEINADLDYRIDKLLGTGFMFTGSPDAEIDAILKMCGGVI